MIDTITYENLTPGVEYTVTGELMRKSDASGTGIVGSTTFTPTETHGSVDVVFVIPEGYAGQTLVAFEELYEGAEATGNLVAEHTDINDLDQTVTVEAVQESLDDPRQDELAETGTSGLIAGGAIGLLLLGAVLLSHTRTVKRAL